MIGLINHALKCAISLSKGIKMSGERRQVMDPDVELEAIMRVELPAELSGPDPHAASVLPEGLCRRLSPELDWQWVTGFRDSGVQFIVERALPHFRGTSRRNLLPNESIFSHWHSSDSATRQLTLQSWWEWIHGLSPAQLREGLMPSDVVSSHSHHPVPFPNWRAC